MRSNLGATRVRPATAPLRVLVTDAQELSALGAVRSLGRAGHEIVVAYPHDTARPPAGASRFRAGLTTHPDAWQEQAGMQEWLQRQIISGDYDVALPSTEASIVAAAAVRRYVPPELTLLMPSDEHLRYTLSKHKATAAAMAAGLTVPPTAFLRDEPGGPISDGGLAALSFPIVVKMDNYLQGDRYVKGQTFVCSSSDDALRLLGELGDSGGGPLIAQEHVAGSGIGGFAMRWGGRTILTFSHARLHEVPYTGGMSSLRESTRDEEVLEATERLLDSIGYEGLAMVEFRGQVGGRPHFLEINGRLWGSIALALHAGVDFPLAWLECMRGGYAQVRQPDYRLGVRSRDLFPGEFEYLRSVLRPSADAAFAAPPTVATVVELARLSADPRVHGDTFWLRDPAPGLALLTSTVRRVRHSVARRSREAREVVRDRVLLRRVRRRGESTLLPTLTPPSTVCFLCFGNICRSPFAARYWEKAPVSGVQVVSAGFHLRSGRQSPTQCHDAAQALGVDLGEHRSRVATSELLRTSDVIFVMDIENYRAVVHQYPGVVSKTFLLGLFGDGTGVIADPYTLSAADAVNVFGQIARSVDDVKARMTGTLR